MKKQLSGFLLVLATLCLFAQNKTFVYQLDYRYSDKKDVKKKETFTLDEIYKFEQKLKIKYPNNNFIKDKIRQQLQLLRDKGIIEFVGRGNYKKVNYGNI